MFDITPICTHLVWQNCWTSVCVYRLYMIQQCRRRTDPTSYCVELYAVILQLASYVYLNKLMQTLTEVNCLCRIIGSDATARCVLRRSIGEHRTCLYSQSLKICARRTSDRWRSTQASCSIVSSPTSGMRTTRRVADLLPQSMLHISSTSSSRHRADRRSRSIVHCVRKKEAKMFFLQYLLQNSGNCDEIWYIVSWINLPQNRVNVSHLTWIMSLHYLVKLEMLIAHVLQLSC